MEVSRWLIINISLCTPTSCRGLKRLEIAKAYCISWNLVILSSEGSNRLTSLIGSSHNPQFFALISGEANPGTRHWTSRGNARVCQSSCQSNRFQPARWIGVYWPKEDMFIQKRDTHCSPVRWTEHSWSRGRSTARRLQKPQTGFELSTLPASRAALGGPGAASNSHGRSAGDSCWSSCVATAWPPRSRKRDQFMLFFVNVIQFKD